MNGTAFKFSRHKSAQCAFGVLALFYGFAFFGTAIAGWNAMLPQQFGELAVSGEVEAWAGLQLCASVALALGLLVNGRWRWSAALRLFGAGFISLMCCVLSYSAWTAPEGVAFMIYCAGFAIFGGVVAWWNLVDLRAAMLWGAGDAE
jgi:hypothetical protein